MAGIDAVHAAEAPEAAAAQVGEAHVVGVVRPGQNGHLVVAEEAVDHGSGFVAVVEAVSARHVAEPAVLHALLDGEVDDGLLFAVVNAGEPGQVGLAVNDLQLFDDVDRQVFGGYLGVVGEELLAVDQNLGNLFPGVGYLALAVDLDARQFFQQVFHYRVGLGFVGVGIEFDSIFLDYYLGGFPHDDGLLQQDVVAFEQNRAQVAASLSGSEPHGFVGGLVAQKREGGDVVACLGDIQGERAVVLTRYSGNESAVAGREQPYAHLGQRQLVAFVFDNSRNRKLRTGILCGHQTRYTRDQDQKTSLPHLKKSNLLSTIITCLYDLDRGARFNTDVRFSHFLD